MKGREGEIADLKKERDVIVAQREALAAKHMSLIEEHTMAMSTVETEHKSKLDGISSEADAKLATLRSELESSSATKLSEMETAHSKTKAELATLESTHAKTKAELAEAKTQANTSGSKVEEQAATFKKMEAELAEKAEQVSTLEAEIAKMKGSLDAAVQKEEALEKLIDNLQKEQTQAGADKDASEQRVSLNSPVVPPPGLGASKWAPPSPFPAEISSPASDRPGLSRSFFPTLHPQESGNRQHDGEVLTPLHYDVKPDGDQSRQLLDRSGRGVEEPTVSATLSFEGTVRLPFYLISALFARVYLLLLTLKIGLGPALSFVPRLQSSTTNIC